MSIDQVDRGVADGAADGAGIILGFDALDSRPDGYGGAIKGPQRAAVHQQRFGRDPPAAPRRRTTFATKELASSRW